MQEMTRRTMDPGSSSPPSSSKSPNRVHQFRPRQQAKLDYDHEVTKQQTRESCCDPST